MIPFSSKDQLRRSRTSKKPQVNFPKDVFHSNRFSETMIDKEDEEVLQPVTALAQTHPRAKIMGGNTDAHREPLEQR